MAASSNEVEATITRLSSHRGVKGILILSSESGRVIRFTGSMLEDPAAGSAAAASAVNGDAIDTPLEVTTNGDASHARQITGPVKRYADMVRRIVENSKQGVEEVDEQVGNIVITNDFECNAPSRTRSNFCGYERRSMN